ncbi:MAG: CCA tRNA nucleotidyltransferase, partial [Lentisphaerae bacterium]|nr:CCA tRNA nucleotidyltransferase [Lentisphaerota bacterium]
PPPLLTGRDLIGLGIQPGPAMGKLLNRLRDLQLEGEISNRAEALETVKKLQE